MAQWPTLWLKPHTVESKCAYADYLANLTGQPLKPATIFVVHSWRMEHQCTLIAVAKAIHEINGGIAPSPAKNLLKIDWHKEHQPQNLTTSVFFCTYAVDQYGLEKHPVGTPGCQIDKLHLVAQRIHEKSRNPMDLPIVVAIDEDKTALKSSCCLEDRVTPERCSLS